MDTYTILLETIKSLEKFESDIDSIIDNIKPEDFPFESINWGDLGCVRVAVEIEKDFQICLVGYIEEADPSNFSFVDYIQNRLKEIGYKNVSIRCDW